MKYLILLFTVLIAASSMAESPSAPEDAYNPGGVAMTSADGHTMVDASGNAISGNAAYCPCNTPGHLNLFSNTVAPAGSAKDSKTPAGQSPGTR